MRFISDQVDMAKAALVAPPAILKLSKGGYGGGLRVRFEGQYSIDQSKVDGIDEEIVKAVKGSMSPSLNIKTGQWRATGDTSSIVTRAIENTVETITVFISNHGGYANNRLSTLYKWYKAKIHAAALRNNEQLAKDMYSLAKFINAENGMAEHRETARKLLILIRNRYEPILGSI